MCYPGNVSLWVGFSYISVKCIYLCFGGSPGGSDGKESTCNAGNPGSIPVLEKSPGEGPGLPTPAFPAWSILRREEPGLQSTGLQRVRHN